MHRCLARHGISRLPASEVTATKRSPFTETRIGFVHIDSCELRTAEGKVHLFVAIDRVSKFTVVELHLRATSMIGAALLRGVVAAFPYKLRAVLTDNGVAFTGCASTKWDYKVHPFQPVLRRARHHPQARPALSPVDQRAGRAHEPHPQRGHGQGVSL